MNREHVEKMNQLLNHYALTKGTKTFTLQDIMWHLNLPLAESFEIASYLAVSTDTPIEMVYHVVCPKIPTESLFETIANQHRPVAYLDEKHFCSTCKVWHSVSTNHVHVNFKVATEHVQSLQPKKENC